MQLIIIMLIAISPSYTQTFNDYIKKYPENNEVVLKDIQRYEIFTENGKLKVTSENNYESLILNELGIKNNEETFSYSELIKLLDFEAYTINNIEGKLKSIPVKQVFEKVDEDRQVFHDGIKVKQLIFPNIQKGSIKKYSYKTEFSDPFLLHRFTFGNRIPTEHTMLEVVVDKNIKIGYKIFNDPNHIIQFKEFEKKGKIIHQWYINDIKSIKYEDDSPGFLHIIPNINVYVEEYEVNNTQIPVLGTIDKLYNYYKNFINKIDETENVVLINTVAEIIKDASTNEEKVKKIYYWVKDNIKYLAFEEGYEGFIPRSSTLVFDRKFGDCKDMANLIHIMSTYANVPNVYLCWIGTRSIPYSYMELPTPGVDNHMIAVYFNEKNEYIFLDATDKYSAYGYPSDFIQGKEALVSKGDTYEIIKVPIVGSSSNRILEEIDLEIVNDKLIGSGFMSFLGYNKTNILYAIGNKNDKARFDKIKSILLKGNNKFNLIDFTEKNFFHKDLPYIIDFKFELPDYIVKIDNFIYINLFLDQLVSKLVLEPNRKYTYDLEFLFQSKATYKLKLPPSYKIKYLPKNENISNDLFNATITFKSDTNSIYLNVDFTNKKMYIEPSDFDIWNRELKKIKEVYLETITLEKNEK